MSDDVKNKAVKNLNNAKPMSDKEIIDLCEENDFSAKETAMFLAGVRTAEQFHGIKGE